MDFTGYSESDLIAEIRKCATLISTGRARQSELIRRLSDRDVARHDGSHSVVEWVMSRLDVSLAEAYGMVYSHPGADHHLHAIDRGFIRNVSHPAGTVSP